MSQDYKNSVFLPKTSFALHTKLPEMEARLLAQWKQAELADQLRDANKGKGSFVLHDGPPYANGPIHVGHAQNKILKDMTNRLQRMAGKQVVYVPGWDCHGLPIEWEVEKQYRAAKQSKDDVPVLEFRAKCREFAAKWVGLQSAEFQRLGVDGVWQQPYLTMDFSAESVIAQQLLAFKQRGLVYRGRRSVMWSVVEKTALAEAEVEYHDHSSTAVTVRFPLVSVSAPELAGAYAVIWTTTPWTLPSNRAIAYNPDMTYLLVELQTADPNGAWAAGDRLLVAEALQESLTAALSQTAGVPVTMKQLHHLQGKDLSGSIACHPLHGQGYEQQVPLLPAEFVTAEQGTGLVHIAPAHGQDDFILGQQFGLNLDQYVGDDGVYDASTPLFAGHHVFKVAPVVLEALQAAGALLHQQEYVHSYPHSWRSRAPLIFRTVPQWFIAMDQKDSDGKTLRDTAKAAIEATDWYPAVSRNRISSMVAGRPDWCISRQRTWGVPIPYFVRKSDQQLLADTAVDARIVQLFAKHGADAWYSLPASAFLGDGYNADEYEQVMDIVDVWFESGVTHAFVLAEAGKDKWPELSWPADLYLEGSDQHRGWFQSSLLASCGLHGRAPYQAVMTHGFVMDGDGRKMSKSLGNVIAPQEVVRQHGADVLRLWVATSNTAEDTRISPQILQSTSDMYRRFRNTLRYLLGALEGWVQPAQEIPYEDLPALERVVLEQLRHFANSPTVDFDWPSFIHDLHHFCAMELSATYFDIRKDVLYCDGEDSNTVNGKNRQATLQTFAKIFDCLVRWLAPVLVFTAEEAWGTRYPKGHNGVNSVHLTGWGKIEDHVVAPAIPLPSSPNKTTTTETDLLRVWHRIQMLRRVVLGGLEQARQQKLIGSGLQAAVTLYLDEAALKDDQQQLIKEKPIIKEALELFNLAEVAIVSFAEVAWESAPTEAFRLADVPYAAVVVTLAEGDKCGRCWKVLPEVGSVPAHPDLCGRCATVVAAQPLQSSVADVA
jgi:isoleucyl-tRNA synthetase